MRYRLFLTILLALVFLTGHAQGSADEVPYFKKVTHAFMPSITAEYFFFSEDGLIWFSTAKGLASFDGSELLYHSTMQQTTLFGLSKVGAMQEDKEHNFYLTTPLGLFYYDRKNKSFSKLNYTDRTEPGEPSVLFAGFYYDPNGLLYIGSVFNGLFIYNPANKHFEHINLDNTKTDNFSDRTLNTVSCFAAHATDSSKLWVGTYHGIYLFDKQKKQFSQRFEIITDTKHIYNALLETDRQAIDVQRMDVTNDSIIWFNSWASGFANYNTRTGKSSIVFGNDGLYKSKDLYYGYIIPKFAKLSAGKYLLGIFNGKTVVYDTRTKKATYFNVSEKNYDYEQTRYVDKDRKGNTWVLQRGFLYVSIPPEMRLQHVAVKGLNGQQPELSGIYFAKTDNLMYGAFVFSPGINVFDTTFQLKTIFPTMPINNYYNYGSGIDQDITKDGSGRLWTAGWINQVLMPGEKKFVPADKKISSLKWLAQKGEYSDAVTTRDGNILLRQNSSIVYHINQHTFATDTIICPPMKATGVEMESIKTFYDPERNFIYLQRKEGLAQYNLTTKEMKHISGSAFFGNLAVSEKTGIPELDAKGRIWILIPQYGFRIIDPVSLLCIDSVQYGEKGLMRRAYDQVKGGPVNYIFLHSQNGIVVYNYKTRRSFLFDNTNGLSSPEDKSLLSANGYMIVGQRGGFDYFNVSSLDNYSPAVTPWLNTVYADSSKIFSRSGTENKERIKLSYRQNTISFSFSAPEFFFPERIEYAYQLWPVDEKFSQTDFFNRKITYSKLHPGKYTFRLKAQMEGGNWEGNATEYHFEIIPAYWQTNWFKFLCIVLACGLLFFAVRWRIASIRKQEKRRVAHEKELMELEAKALRAQMNPHFIFNSLNSIKSLINKNENEKAAGYLSIFSKLIRTLFQNSDKREVSLFEEIETCKLYTQIEKMRFGEKVKFVFDVEENIDLKDIKVPALILQPFIENAIWHGLVPKESGGQVTVSIKEINGAVTCIIDDNGIGREVSGKYKAQYEATYESKGIGLTKARLELDKLLNDREDKITIIDKKDSTDQPGGTKVIITFKQNEN